MAKEKYQYERKIISESNEKKAERKKWNWKKNVEAKKAGGMATKRERSYENLENQRNGITMAKLMKVKSKTTKVAMWLSNGMA